MTKIAPSLKSLSNLKPRFSKWKNSATKTIRVPKVLADDLIKYAVILDGLYGSNEKLYLIPIQRLYSQLDEIYGSKKSLKVGLDRFRAFLATLVEENTV